MRPLSTCFAALFISTVHLASGTAEEGSGFERGHALVARLCAGCHAIEAADASRHPSAPPFRQVKNLLDFDVFVDRLRDGLAVGHADMPTFRFTRRDARAVAAYLSSLQPQPLQ